MNGQLAFVTFTLFVALILAVGIASFSWQRRHAGVWTYPFFLLTLAAAWWTGCYLLELRASGLERAFLG